MRKQGDFPDLASLTMCFSCKQTHEFFAFISAADIVKMAARTVVKAAAK
jgi:hypothetical protein